MSISKWLGGLTVAFLVTSCSSVPDKPVFSDAVAVSKAQHIEYAERKQIDIGANCSDGACTLPRVKLQALTDTISKMRDKDEKRVDAYNLLVDAIHHCQHRNNLADWQIQIMKNEVTKEKIISTARNVAYMALCGAGLIYR